MHTYVSVCVDIIYTFLNILLVKEHVFLHF